ncbi:bride of doubletime [Oratosquilla oratoria]|uniref:bride of doubletime n=1 Tax=Oratosquilla oratoria TaxID=337810 RepID=UPI003F7626A1
MATTGTAVLEKLEKARELKIEGNAFFKEKSYRKAVRSYHSGLLYLKGINQVTPYIPVPQNRTQKISQETQDEITSLVVDFHNNIAACLLKQDNIRYERVLECCQQVTQLQPGNSKGWYRMGLAYFHLHNYDEAKKALEEANKLSNQDISVRKLLHQTNVALAKEDEKFKSMFRNSLLK